jgi:hypothetical protein
MAFYLKCVQHLQIDRRFCCSLPAAEQLGRSREQLVPPVGDLIGTHVVLLRQLGQRFVALNSG